MKRHTIFLFLLAAVAVAAKTPDATLAKAYNSDVTAAEKEIVSLAEAMPADKYNFAPTGGEFTGVRTFALQMRHIATIDYVVAAALLEEKNPVEMGISENGADSLTDKDAIVKYLKDSFAYAHKAIDTITEKNVMGEVKSPFGQGKATRASLATIFAWHSFDHYGQAVVYARMNGVVPPASRR